MFPGCPGETTFLRSFNNLSCLWNTERLIKYTASEHSPSCLEACNFLVWLSTVFTFKFIFNWRIIIVGFCHTTMWISCMYSCIPFHLSFPPQPRSSQSPALSPLCYEAASHEWSVLHVVVYICQCYSLNSSHLLLPLLCPQICSLCLLLHCCPANWFICAIFLDSIYIYIYIYICISIRFTLHCMTGSRFICLVSSDSDLFLFIAE